MTHRSFLAIAALAVPALLALSPRGTEISFGLEGGSSVTKTFSSEISMTLDDMQMTMNGQEPPMMPEMDLSVTVVNEIEISDEYISVRAGMPLEIERTFDSLSMDTEMAMEIDMMGQVQSEEIPTTASSELEGTTVTFKWDADEEEYVITFTDGEGDEDLLEGLTADMDFRSLLPDGEVDVDDQWEVDIPAFAAVLAPGGNLKLIPENVDAGMMGMNSNFGSTSDWFQEDVEGQVIATFTGTRESDDGVALAVIEITVEIENAVDMTDMMLEAMDEADLPPEVQDMEIDHMDIEVAIEAEATLMWNLEEGRAESFELSGDFEFIMDMGMAISTQGMEMEMEQVMEMSGTMTISATFE